MFQRASSAVRGAGRSIFSSCRKVGHRDAGEESIFIRRVREAEAKEQRSHQEEAEFHFVMMSSDISQ